MQYLILGATGYLGSYFYSRLTMEGLRVIGTGRRNGNTEGLVKFDILRDSIHDIAKLISDDKKIAIICIAQTNIDQCKIQYELSNQINVVLTKKIVEVLIQEKFHVIFFSTDNVFNGLRGHYTEEDKTNAINQYGKMKAEMECFLTKEYPEVCIFRLPKVLGVEKEQKNLLTDLESKLSNNIIRCIRHTKMSIVAKEDIYQACTIVAERKLSGIYNLSSGEIYSRRELTEKFYTHMNILGKRIIELDLKEFKYEDERPLNISLDNSKFRRETGYEFKSFDIIAEQYLRY